MCRAIEVHDGQGGIGITNAIFALDRAIELAEEHGLGAIALNYTTHWMRGGTLWLARGVQGLGGNLLDEYIGVHTRLGREGDMCRKQSCGHRGCARRGPIGAGYGNATVFVRKTVDNSTRGRKIAVSVGYDVDGNLTDDPGLIEKSRRIQPTGYWKGSGRSIMLDVMAALLSSGLASHELGGKDGRG